MTPKMVVPQTSEDVVSLISTGVLAILAVIIVTALYVGREISYPSRWQSF